MRYFILFFCLLFGQNTTIQANYSAPQIANYQIVSAEISNPIEPIQPKKIKKVHPAFGDWSDEDWGNLTIGFSAIIFILGLIFFPYAFMAGFIWLWQGILWAESLGLLILLLTFFIFRPSHKSEKPWGGIFLISFLLVALVFIALKGIELIILGLTISLTNMWLIGIFLVALSLIILLIGSI